MSEKIIKCRKAIYCDQCENQIKYGDKYKKCVEVIDDEIYIINFCIDCNEKHELAEVECKKGNHDFIEKVNTVWEFGVPYPEYTDEFVCENCDITKTVSK